MLLLAILACRAEIAGLVIDDAGAPVVGAHLVSTGNDAQSCEAVTDSEGRFRTRCARGTWTFAVTHPDHLPASWKVEGDSREVAAGSFRLVALPGSAGAWVTDGVRFQALAGAQLHRVATTTTQDWCLPADASPIVLGPGARLFRNEPPTGGVPADAERWRLYRVSQQVVDASPAQSPALIANATSPASGGAAASIGITTPASDAPAPAVPSVAPEPGRCVFHLRKGSAEHWEFAAERVPLDGEGTARLWTDLGALPSGDYVLAPWVGGMFVREDVSADTWRGVWLRVPIAPGAASAP